MKKLLFVVFFLCPFLVKAQGIAYNSIALYNSSGTARVVPSALITVCPQGSLGEPCTPANVSLTSDIAQTMPLTNPFNADFNGNFNFVVNPGNYTVTITGIGVVGYSYQVSLLSGGAAIGSCTTSGGVVYQNGTPNTGTCGTNFVYDPVNKAISFVGGTGNGSFEGFPSVAQISVPTNTPWNLALTNTGATAGLGMFFETDSTGESVIEVTPDGTAMNAMLMDFDVVGGMGQINEINPTGAIAVAPSSSSNGFCIAQSTSLTTSGCFQAPLTGSTGVMRLPNSAGVAGQGFLNQGGSPQQLAWISSVVECGTIAAGGACGNTTGAVSHCVSGIATLSGGTSTISSISPAFTSSTSFTVITNDLTTSSNPSKGAPASASSITFTGTGTDNIGFIACGG